MGLILFIIYFIWSWNALRWLLGVTGLTLFNSIGGLIVTALCLGIVLIPLQIIIAIFRAIFGRR